MKAKKDIVILVIDDDEAIARMLVAILRRCGYSHIFCAGSGEKGIEMIGYHHPDLIIVDQTLPPGMIQGKEVIEWITREYKPRFSSIKIMAFSGDRQEEVEPAVRKAGADGFLHKSCGRDGIIKAVEALLA